ncbi:TPA: hypothetical protein N0F65_000837 [Lagenidium giganteum]|uniref:LTD domain-containing protein n=1 Tax=Lagenidium giganteum TaxID=4803 RepID=A0AAV2YVF7_9STRA|nr:TPA: hypothetical protein N0F65_000837 [Lagenidium giganteum]
MNAGRHYCIATCGTIATRARPAMKYPLLRRLRLPTLDRQVARASMQICHKVVMQQLYISRVDVQKQWVVISNPSDQAIDLTGYTVTNADASKVFHFPSKYILMDGEEVTIWCSPDLLTQTNPKLTTTLLVGSINLVTDNLLQPYLFWTRPDGSLRNAPFFLPRRTNEVVLLDPFMIEVASLQVSESGKKDFRVLNCVSAHAPASHTSSNSSSSSSSLIFCAGCLSPPSLFTSLSGRGPARPSRRRYVFSRYWGVVSDKPFVKHFLAVLLAPVVESLRAVFILKLLLLFQNAPSREALQRHSPALGWHVACMLTWMVALDVLARRLSLWVKSGHMVTIMSCVSLVLDQLAVVALYSSLDRVYPELRPTTSYLWMLELALACVCLTAVHCEFLDHRRQWHPVFKQLARLDYFRSNWVLACAAGRDLLLYVLLVLPFTGRSAVIDPSSRPWLAPLIRGIGYALVPLFTMAVGMDFIRGAAMLWHLLRYPWLHHRQRRRRHHSRSKSR